MFYYVLCKHYLKLFILVEQAKWQCAYNIISFRSDTYNVHDMHIYLPAKHSPRHKHWPAGPAHFSDRRASTFYLSLARTGHLDICRATRFQIVLARTMTNHSMYFSRGHLSHISALFAQSFCYSETPACRESEMSIKHTDVSV